MRLTVVPAVVASLVAGSCALDFGRFDATMGASPGSLIDGSANIPIEASLGDVGATMSEASAGDGATQGAEGGPYAGSGGDAVAGDAADGTSGSDGGDLGVGLVAFYPFDETSGTTAADSSGNNRTATLVGGATFSSGLQNNAVTLNGSNEYVSLPGGIVSGLTSFSICAWVNLSAATTWSRIFDFGTGTTAFMFLTPNSSAGTLRFSITIGGSGQEQQMNAATLATGSWQQVAVTLAANTGTLYVNGVQVAQNTSMTLNPGSRPSRIPIIASCPDTTSCRTGRRRVRRMAWRWSSPGAARATPGSGRPRAPARRWSG